MKSFIIAWFVAFGVVAMLASGVTYYVASRPAPPVNRVGNTDSSRSAEADSGPFSEAEAIDVVSRRLPSTASASRLRNELQRSATVTYHSFRHWRVCIDDACWVAHGPGRYAEPENDAARRHEGLPPASPTRAR